MKKAILLSLISILLLTSCKAKEVKPKEAKVNTFKSVSMEEGLQSAKQTESPPTNYSTNL